MTDMIPFYDSFVRWQFWTLYRQVGRVCHRPLVPCVPHERV
jgi:hypothetical protein